MDQSLDDFPPEDNPEYYLSLQGQTRGPYPLDKLSKLIREGRLAPATMVWQQSWSSWRKIGDVPEFQDVLRRSSPSVPPPLPPIAGPPPVPTSAGATIPGLSDPLPDDLQFRSDDQPRIANVRKVRGGEDDDLGAEWRSRKGADEAYAGLMGSLLAKVGFKRHIRVATFTHTVRIPKRNEFGELVLIDEVVGRLTELYMERGFHVGHTMDGGGLLLDKSGKIPEGGQYASGRLQGIVRFGELENTWLVKLKAETQYWTDVIEQFQGGVAVLVMLAILIALVTIVGIICLCMLAGSFATNEEGIKASTSEQFKGPMGQLVMDFK